MPAIAHIDCVPHISFPSSPQSPAATLPTLMPTLFDLPTALAGLRVFCDSDPPLRGTGKPLSPLFSNPIHASRFVRSGPDSGRTLLRFWSPATYRQG